MMIRHFQTTPDDLPALARLLAAIPEFAASSEDYSEASLAAQAAAMSGSDLTRDRWVAEAPDTPGSLIGYAALFLFPGATRADLQIAVHPDWRRRGLGVALLREALAEAQARSATDANVYASEQDAGAAAFARAQGFTPHSAFTRLVAPQQSFPAPSFPPGYTARACQSEEDYPRFIESANTCYGDLWGHNPITEELGHDWFASMEPAGVCFVFGPDGALVGRSSAQIMARDGEPSALIDAPGVVPAHRAAGLYVPLLLWEIAWSARVATPPARYIIESWGDADATLAAYQSLGFAVETRETAWRYPL